MAGTTNFYFRQTEYVPDQYLVQDLVDEAISIFGWDVYYLPKNHSQGIDQVFKEDTNSTFPKAIPIVIYVQTFDGFTGQGDLLAKFGLSTADQITISMSRRDFEEEIGRKTGMIRPNEGDLVFFPLTNGIFEISFVEHEASFYAQGALYYYQISATKFNYSSETFATGIPAIDVIQTKFTLSDQQYYILMENGSALLLESGDHIINENYDVDLVDPSAQNEIFDLKANAGLLDFSEHDPFADSQEGKY